MRAHTNGALSLPCPVNTKMLATIGDAALVPPICSIPPLAALNIATPVAGSATAETSVAARPMHAVCFSYAGFAIEVLHVLPVAPCEPGGSPRNHTVSVRGEVDASDVPPTAITYCDVDG